LNELEKRGLLERIQGSGNYVRSKTDAANLYSMFRLELIAGGGLPRAEFLSVEDMTKPQDLPQFGQSDRATRMRRLRSLDDTIIAVEEIWLDQSAGALRDFDLSESLYHTYKTALNLVMTRAEDRATIGNVPVWTPDEFGMTPGAHCGYIERFAWANTPQPIEFSRTWFAPDRAIYVQRLGGAQ